MAMFGILESLAGTLCSTLRNRRDLALENLALRQQVAILRRQVRRPKLTLADRLFWVGLMRTWDGWKDSLILVRPETVIRWFREGFKWYWTRRSRRLVGRPGVDPELRSLVRTMAMANPLWGAPRIPGDLLRLGFEVSQ